MKQLLLFLLSIIALNLSVVPITHAHSGRTDSTGCHNDNKNNERHCHNGNKSNSANNTSNSNSDTASITPHISAVNGGFEAIKVAQISVFTRNQPVIALILTISSRYKMPIFQAVMRGVPPVNSNLPMIKATISPLVPV